MTRSLKKLLLTIAIIYCGLYIFISPQSANFLLASFVILYIAAYFVKLLFADFFYQFSDRLVPKSLKKDKNTLINENCIVKYTPDKLSVEENYTAEQRREKRIFTIYKRNGEPINRCWNAICHIFDSYTYFDSLSALISKITPIKIKLIPTGGPKRIDNEVIEKHAQTKTGDSKFVQNDVSKNPQNDNPSQNKPNSDTINMDEVTPDSYGISDAAPAKEENYFVDINNIKKINPSKEKE